MCRFFTDKKATQGILLILLVAPFIAGIVSFSRSDNSSGYLCLNWLGALGVGASLGWLIKEKTVCPLLHLPENVELEPSRIEGRQEVGERDPGEPSQLRM